MTKVILVLNAGSSSIKFSIFAIQDVNKSIALMYRGEIEGIGTQPRFVVSDAASKHLVDERLTAKAGTLSHEDVLAVLFGWIENHTAGLNVIAAGHRVVHGGVLFSSPVLVNPAVISQLERLVPLAPLHQPHNVAAIKALSKIKPNLPQVACFDTAFHHTQPPIAQTFALPRDLSEVGVKRYGFHGLSYEYIAHVLPDFVGTASYGGLTSIFSPLTASETIGKIVPRNTENAAPRKTRLLNGKALSLERIESKRFSLLSRSSLLVRPTRLGIPLIRLHFFCL